jgi:hypothetical protein
MKRVERWLGKKTLDRALWLPQWLASFARYGKISVDARFADAAPKTYAAPSVELRWLAHGGSKGPMPFNR